MLLILISISLLFRASASHITGYGNTTAVYGGDAHYRCAVDNPTGVLQVTWQRLFRDESIENLATYSKRFGQQVNDPYIGKVVFTEASLSSASITVKNVTWEDESCYICAFNVYPDGSKRKQTCLIVQGISQVHTRVHVPSTGPDQEHVEAVFSCSATGKPAPTIQWNFTSAVTEVEQPQTITETNGGHTFTSSRNITLKVPPYWSGHVDCLLNSGMAGQRQERIYYTREGREKDGEPSLRRSGVAFIIIILICISTIAVAVVMKRKGLKCNRINEPV
ncbi:OX-2 membrane glycoprotein Precursor [Channa argus]|uniref:OX-2 membrane glycoprotein n=1 Tax=Channa argus TaxID=215402 RepID=A0A6G1PE57_CHAAH|nr:OX-2 membrane glycoprotein Precursor [Channa argus]KAK2917520.1 hypothetical protein Q8A73_004266 [Channa argus]